MWEHFYDTLEANILETSSMGFSRGDVCRHTGRGRLVIITDARVHNMSPQDADPEFDGDSYVVAGVYMDDMKEALDGVEGAEAFRYGLRLIHQRGDYPFIADRLEQYGTSQTKLPPALL